MTAIPTLITATTSILLSPEPLSQEQTLGEKMTNTQKHTALQYGGITPLETQTF